MARIRPIDRPISVVDEEAAMIRAVWTTFTMMLGHVLLLMLIVQACGVQIASSVYIWAVVLTMLLSASLELGKQRAGVSSKPIPLDASAWDVWKR
ncbi:MAG: hypothetical protein ACYTF0_03930 [Planctomycetota bacterium]|jgi:hypothetical protein